MLHTNSVSANEIATSSPSFATTGRRVGGILVVAIVKSFLDEKTFDITPTKSSKGSGVALAGLS
jgi:hypothetical protein